MSTVNLLHEVHSHLFRFIDEMYALIKQFHISPAQITRLRRNESVSTHTIDMFCRILNCKVEDIMEYFDE